MKKLENASSYKHKPDANRFLKKQKLVKIIV